MASLEQRTSDTDTPAAKRQRTSTSPKSCVTWNCNGFLSRAKWNSADLARLVDETGSPDVICLQEVRLKALSPSRRDVATQKDYQAVKHHFEEGGVFCNYSALWSLADTRYSGTLTLLHKRLLFDAEHHSAFSCQGAIDLMLETYKLTHSDVGNSISKSPKKKQASVKSFFAPVNKEPRSKEKQHNEQGRFQFLHLEGMDLIHTYVPNNGNKTESFARRKMWDDGIKDFLLNRSKILTKAGITRRPLLWCGDMNVARDYRDGTHWIKTEDGTVQEWWTDEQKCFASASQRDPSRHSQDQGMPSFTQAERSRFEDILAQANLTDVWRKLHPNGADETDETKILAKWDKPNYTWRGHLGKNGTIAKYQGKGQRLDYFLTSNVDNVETCKILGFGERRDGLFCGSDHCASILTLRD